MAEIQLRMIEAPSFSGVNALMASAAKAQGDGFRTLQDTLKGSQTAIRDQNTARLLDQVNQAKTTAEFNAPAFQQGLRDFQASLGGEYHTKDFQKTMEARPDMLMGRDINQTRLDNALTEQNDAPIVNEILAKRTQNPNADVTALLGQLQGNQAGVLMNLDGLKTSHLARQNTTQSMTLAQKTHNMQAQEFAEQQKYRQQLINGTFGVSEAPNAGITLGGGAGTQKTYGDMAQWNEMIGEASRTYGVPVNVIQAIVEQESGGRNGQTSSAGAQGLMQLMPNTAARFGVQAGNRMDPRSNISAGTQYLSFLGKRYGGDWAKATTAYFAGEGNMDKMIAGGKANNQTWTQYMARRGNDGKVANPNSVKYLQDVAARMQKYAGSARDAVGQLSRAELSPNQASLYYGGDLGAYAQAHNTVQNGGQGVVPQNLAQMLQGQAPEAQKAILDTQLKQDQIANASNNELLNKQINTSPLYANLGKAGGGLQEWGKQTSVTYKDELEPGTKTDIISILNNDAATRGLPPAMKASLAHHMAQTAIAEDASGLFDMNGPTSKENLRKMAREAVQEFTSARQVRDQNDSEMLSRALQNQLTIQQLNQAQESKDKQMALLKQFAGL